MQVVKLSEVSFFCSASGMMFILDFLKSNDFQGEYDRALLAVSGDGKVIAVSDVDVRRITGKLHLPPLVCSQILRICSQSREEALAEMELLGIDFKELMRLVYSDGYLGFRNRSYVMKNYKL